MLGHIWSSQKQSYIITKWIGRYFLVIMVLLTFSAKAAPVWPAGPYPYTIIDQDLPTVLKEFGQNVGIRVDISPKVQGRVKGKPPQVSAESFFTHLCRIYGLEWYHDGFTIFVSSVNENTTRFLTSPKVTLEQLKAELERLGFYDSRFSLRQGTTNDTLLVVGPPRYQAIVSQTLNQMVTPPARTDAVPTQTVIYRANSVSVVNHTPSQQTTKE